jgi:hypothetical protein
VAEHERLLRQVAQEAGRYGGVLQPPCDDRALDVLRRRVRDELGVGLPAGLEEFLRLTDGLNWNGLYLYPSATAPLVGHPDVVLPGLVESNLDHRGVEGLDDVLVLGNDSLDLFAWHCSTNEFQVLDLVPRDVMATVPSFDALLTEALERCLRS